MTDERFTDNLIEGTEAKTDALRDYDLAKDALKRADATALFRLYQKAIKQRNDLLGVVVTLAQEGFGAGVREKTQVSAPPDVTGLKEVAMAAVRLAEQVIHSRSTAE